MKNRKTLIFVGVALLGLGLCACAAITLLVFRTSSDNETAERAADTTPVVETLVTEVAIRACCGPAPWFR